MDGSPGPTAPGPPERQRDPVDLTALVHDCVERARVADPARTWQAHVAADLGTVGDRAAAVAEAFNRGLLTPGTRGITPA